MSPVVNTIGLVSGHQENNDEIQLNDFVCQSVRVLFAVTQAIPFPFVRCAFRKADRIHERR